MPLIPSSPNHKIPSAAQQLCTPIQRRTFFKYAGATAGVTALALAGCKKDQEIADPLSTSVSFGSGDVGVLNYLYALEQLEAAFYLAVHNATTSPQDFTSADTAYFTQIATHEAIHRDFLKYVINRDAAGRLLQNLTPNFPIDFNNTTRTAVLGLAKTLEDLGVAAYNGAALLLKTPAYLVLVGQIVSVEARHAAYVRNTIDNNNTGTAFADDMQVDALTGLDMSITPTAVITIAQTYITEPLDASSVGQ